MKKDNIRQQKAFPMYLFFVAVIAVIMVFVFPEFTGYLIGMALFIGLPIYLIFYYGFLKKKKNRGDYKPLINGYSNTQQDSGTVSKSNSIKSSTSNYRYNASFPYIEFKQITEDFPDDYVVLDFETSGLNFINSRIVEIGCIRIRNKQVVDSFSTLVDPEIQIPIEATRVNNITNNMVKDQPKIYEVIDDLISFIGEDTIVAHNIKFDLEFLVSAIFGKYTDYKIRSMILDTLSVARSVLPRMENYKLVTLKKELKINTDSHRAVGDCMATYELLEICKKKLATEKELEEWSRKTVIESFSPDEKIFYDHLLEQMSEKKIEGELVVNRMANGTLNFCLNDLQIGRLKFKGKKTIQTVTKSDVVWIDIETIEEALTISKMWIKYYQSK